MRAHQAKYQVTALLLGATSEGVSTLWEGMNVTNNHSFSLQVKNQNHVPARVVGKGGLWVTGHCEELAEVEGRGSSVLSQAHPLPDVELWR